MKGHLEILNINIGQWLYSFELSLNEIFCQVLSLSCKTPLQDLVLKCVLLNMHINSATYSSSSRNKYKYRVRQTAQLEMCTFDISTCKLWCAILLYMTEDYQSTLDILNQVLSSIPPYAMHRYVFSDEAELLYMDVFGVSDFTMLQKAKKAWMFEMLFCNGASYPLPLAIKIELYFSYFSITLSPFACAYYLQFLSYFNLRNYENMNRVLEQLVDYAKQAIEKDDHSYSDLNIAGHCLLLAEKKPEALDIFKLSYILTQRLSPYRHIQNSARWYLLNYFQIQNEL